MYILLLLVMYITKKLTKLKNYVYCKYILQGVYNDKKYII